MIKKLLKYSVLFVVFGLSLQLIVSQRSFFMSENQFELVDGAALSLEKVRLKSENIKPFMFGFSSLFSDLLWVYTTVEMDLKLPTQKEYNLYYTLAHLFTDLDPYFEPLYIYSANQFMFGRQGTKGYQEAVDDAQEILLKGWDFYLNRTEEWDHYSQYWVIPQLIGFNYYFEYKDKEKALPYYEYIANYVPQAPSLYRTFAAEIYKQLNRKEENLTFLENILMKETLSDQLSLNPDNQELKEKIRRKMIYLQGGEVSQEAVDKYIQQALRRSKQVFETWRSDYAYLTIDEFISLHPEVYNETLDSNVSMFKIVLDDNMEML